MRTQMQAIHRVNFLGVGVSVVDMDRAAAAIFDAAERGERGYVAFLTVHGIMEAYRDALLRRILNRALLCNPDGMPLSWLGWLQGFREINRVYGPDLMLKICEGSQNRPFRHFLLGGNPGVAAKLQQSLQERYPGLQISGAYTPPFRPLERGRMAGAGRPVCGLASAFRLGGNQHPQAGEIHGGSFEAGSSVQCPVGCRRGV